MEKKRCEDNYPEDRYEKPILALMTFVIILLVLVQVMVLNNGSGFANRFLWEYQGTVLGKAEYLYDHGFVILELQGGRPEPDLYVLKNGVQAGSFEKMGVRLEVIHGDVIEIDASEITSVVTVKIADTDMALSKEFANASVSLCNEVKTLLSIK